MRSLAACTAGVIAAGAVFAGDQAVSTFSPAAFTAGEDCAWLPAGAEALGMNAHFIARPHGERDAWLEALRAYRTAVREGKGPSALSLDFRGVRAWVRQALPCAKALALVTGERLAVEVEALSLAGNRELCVAFDVHALRDEAKTGWSEVRATLALPGDGAWHRVRVEVEVPDFDRATSWLRPIVGMDATWNATPGRLRIRDLRLEVKDAARMARAFAAIPPRAPGLDRRIYARPDLEWAASAFTCHFTFMYDRAFYDPAKGYRLDTFLADGAREFGGYDIVVLWQGYPRLGVDPRNQFDMYRDMPGGLAGLRALVGQAHARGVKVFIDYNPWDQGTRHEDVPDEDALARIVEAMDVDGIFLDTMSATSATLRARLDLARRGVALAPEGHPEIAQIAMLSLSWAQGLDDADPPGLLHLKWLEPRHMQHQIRRWDLTHRGEIESAFLNGSGMLVWENIFGTWNPWSREDRALWRRAAAVLRHFRASFARDDFEPFVPTLADGVYAHKWPAGGITLWTLLNRGAAKRSAPLLDISCDAGTRLFDLWHGEELQAAPAGGVARIVGSIERLGCIAALAEARVTPAFTAFLAAQREAAAALASGDDARAESAPAIDPVPVAPAPVTARPAGMTLVPGATITMKLSHQRRECGCYPDPGTPPEKWKGFLWGAPHDGMIEHRVGPVAVASFYIDEAEVANGEFKRFLDATGYRPAHGESFLKHWPGGVMPAELAEHPVVYVDLDDARAYARWAGKRLPTEIEWHLAAQGTDGRAWPWGEKFDAARCNSGGTGTMPARSLPEGASPCGCYHMSGNVWEWTESERDDGHTRFAIIRGGSWFDAKGSIWYVRGGPQPCTHHAKFLRMWPGLDRCATIGFRCVADVNS